MLAKDKNLMPTELYNCTICKYCYEKDCYPFVSHYYCRRFPPTIFEYGRMVYLYPEVNERTIPCAEYKPKKEKEQ